MLEKYFKNIVDYYLPSSKGEPQQISVRFSEESAAKINKIAKIEGRKSTNIVRALTLVALDKIDID